MRQWIDTKERLPELWKEVLVTDGAVIDIAGLRIKRFLDPGSPTKFITEWYSYGHRWNLDPDDPEDDCGPPTHWMPLPRLPRKKPKRDFHERLD